MDDINEKLNTLLSDPDSMARIMQLAQQLSGGRGGQQTAAPPPPAAPFSPPKGRGLISLTSPAGKLWIRVSPIPTTWGLPWPLMMFN